MKNVILQKIDKQYVGDDCVQVMFNYKKGLCIIKDKQIIFYHNCDENEAQYKYKNEYLNDERRLQFPYSDIPSHNERIGFKKYITVNQLLDYDTIYTVIRDIGDGPVTTYCKVVKSKDTAIIIQDIILSSPFYMTCDELESFEISNAKKPRVKTK